MQIASLLLFSDLVTASIHGVRRRQCAESPPPSIGQSSLADISSSPSSTAFDSGSTISLTAVSISSSTPNTETTVPEPFLLQIQARDPQSPPGRKRQESSGSYLEENSSTSPRCQQGALFKLLNGRLLKEGVVITASDPPRAQPLLEAGASRDVSITFSLTDGILSWSNRRFPRQTASFCLLADTVFVYFEDAPADCVDITLSFASLYECPGRQALPSTTASSTWSTVGSQLNPAPILSSRPVSSVYDSLGITSRDPGTLSIFSTAAGSASEASPPGTSTITSDSLIATTVPSQTTFGTSPQLTSSQTSLSTSNGAFLPPEGLSSFSSITTNSPSPSSISAMDQSTEMSPSSSSAGIRSSQSSLFLTSQRTSDVVRPSSTTFDSSRLRSEISEPTSTQSVALPQDSTAFSSALASLSQSFPSPTPYSTSPDTALSRSTVPSSQMVSSSQTSSSSMQSSESPSAPAEGLSMGLLSLASTLTSSWSSPSTSDTSNLDASTSAPGSLQSVESATSNSSRESATSTESPPSSPATSTSTPSTSETSLSGTHTLSTTAPSSASSEGSTSSPTSSTGPLSTFTSSTTNSDITSSITSSSSFASSTSSTSSSSSSSNPPPCTFRPDRICPAAREIRLRFGFITYTAGSIGYTGRTSGDYIAFYATDPPAANGYLPGYLYHQLSGLCATATAPTSSTSTKYTGSRLELQPCGPLDQTPPEAQLFSGYKEKGSVVIVFSGDLAGTFSYYGSASNSESNLPLSLTLFPSREYYWEYDCNR